MIYLILACLGLIWGSFANVVIYRLPMGKSPWNPKNSQCPHCNKRISAWDNIPVISYLILDGKCRSCRKGISVRYPLVEILMAAGFCLVGYRLMREGIYDWAPMAIFCLFFFFLFCITVIDWDTYMIPDALSLGLFVCMVLGSPWNVFFKWQAWWLRPLFSLAGGLCAGGLFLIMALIGEKIYKKEALGGGDIKLFAAIGAALGIHNILLVIILSSLLGLFYAMPQLLLKRLKREDPIPYGPFLATAAFITFLWGDKMALWPFLLTF